MPHGPLSKLLATGEFPAEKEGKRSRAELSELELQMLRIQEGLWHQKKRAIVLFEGFDASGKGGAIRRLTERLDPRALRVWPIGPPSAEEQGKHYLYRFWERLPPPGMLAVFDRSWYGRLLVERVEGLAPRSAWKRAFGEIEEFERMLVDDGIDLVKLFLAIDPKEQLRRFEARLGDPYKQWKLTEDDIRARSHWDDYVRAADALLERNSKKWAPWHLIPANDKPHARLEALRIVTRALGHHRDWMENAVERSSSRSLAKELRALRRL
ncbi:MAG: polyphosphate kinase 2 family protein [Deltaproteobacteria bacterium]